MRWPEAPTESFCQRVLGGGTPSTKKSEYYDGDVPWLRTQEVVFNYIWKTDRTITVDGLRNSSATWVAANSVIVAMFGASAGRVAINTIPLTTNQACCNLVVDSHKADYRYVFYAMCNRYKALESLARDAAQNNLNAKIVREFTIPSPPIDVQRRIGDTLSTYDNLIENNRRRIQLLEQAARLLYKEWFIHLRFPGHEHTPITNGIPQGWERKPLGEIADITMGQSPKSIYYNEDDNGLPFHQGVTNFGARFPSHETYCTVHNRLAEPGDILFSVRAPVGRINITSDKIVIGRGIAAICSNRDQQNFLFYALKSHFFKEDMIGGGVIFAAVTKKDLHSVELVQPLGLLAKMFIEHVKPVDCQIANLHKAIDNLTQARDLLLPRLMNGTTMLPNVQTRIKL